MWKMRKLFKSAETKALFNGSRKSEEENARLLDYDGDAEDVVF